MNLKLHQLNALVAVVEHGSIRAAARALHLSQAALTKSLKLLEEDSAVPLLLRRASGVSLTDAGERLALRARLITRQLTLAEEELKEAAQADASEVRIALTPYLTLTALAHAHRWFRARYPTATVQVLEGLAARALPRLRDGALDFALVGTTSEMELGDFTREPWPVKEQVMVARDGHPLRGASRGHTARVVSAEVAAQQEWALPGPLISAGLGTARFAAMFAAANLPAPARVTRCDAMGVIALVRDTDLLSIFPAPLLRLPETQGISALPVAGLQAPALDLALLRRADVPLSPAATYFAQCLRDAADRG